MVPTRARSASTAKLASWVVWVEFALSLLKLFVKSNQGGEETTKINYLTFIGTPVQATNMNDFKRVSTGLDTHVLVFGVGAVLVG